ncbi:MAG: PQQ-dependent sugar dehydrogenase, partial [Gammaproteobacteria bacterium]|nr:PQQ-dependent sugar dehydrogenase [Gammaproteobacteria bacterium]
MNSNRSLFGWCLCMLFCAMAFSVMAIAHAESPEFKLPPGFSAESWISKVPNARAMAMSENGTLFISTRNKRGKIYAVPDVLSENRQLLVIAEGLEIPNGIAFYKGALYVAEAKRIIRFNDIEKNLASPGPPEVIVADLPYKARSHSWKYLAVGPDQKLYVAYGAPCNVCDAPELSVIVRMNTDGSDQEVFAEGVRNSVGFDWDPATGYFWFSDNGRDMLGDELPPGELNRAEKPGLHFGFPFCHGNDVVDPEFGESGKCEDSVGPAQALDPHVAPLGVRFYTGDMFPAEYQGQVFIAEHGSWNRSREAGKTGYRVSLVRLKDGEPISYEPFMTGFLDAEGKVHGRPVDIVNAPDGSLLVSDDDG